MQYLMSFFNISLQINRRNPEVAREVFCVHKKYGF